MKKNIFSFILLLTLSVAIKAQKVIESPVFEYSTTGVFEIQKVELSDKDTRISFKATYSPN